jgi:cysteine-rich repeat protein
MKPSAFKAPILVVLVALLLAPAAWACVRNDAVCDCGCGFVDPDCGEGFGACVRHACPAGQVPWEHQPETCMSSACGDGWRDERAGEVCDDGDALDRGGCAGDCKRVNAGFTCGERADGCQRTGDAGVPDAGSPPPVDAGVAPQEPAPMPKTGCATAPGLVGLLTLGFAITRRRRSSR